MRKKKLLFVFSFIAQIVFSFNLVYVNNTYFTASPISYSANSEIWIVNSNLDNFFKGIDLVFGRSQII